MITKKKVILITEERSDFLEKFEALKYVEDSSKIITVWENNKTPICTTKDFSFNQEKFENEKLWIPEELISIDKIEEFTEFCHDNGFECGEYSTGEIYDTKQNRCFMCEIAQYKGFSNLQLYNRYVDKSVDCIIYESPNFYVLPELGALKKGYLMIVPKKHILSIAQFPEGYREEYDEVCADVEEILLKAFDGSIVCFMEHGSGPSGKTSHKKSIVHAHTHVVVDFMLKLKFKKMVKLQPCEDISMASNTHYFSYQEGSNGQLMIAMDDEVYVQRQYPRQIMAEELEFAPEQYNWRWYDFEEITDATLFHLHRSLKQEQKGRIYERTKDFVEGFSKRTKRK